LHGNPICHYLSMCGRYRLSRRKQIIGEHFDAVSGEEDWTARYNIAPTQPIPVIRQNPKEPVRELSLVRWGLIPSWAKGLSVAAKMINARSETAATKPAFRDALKSRRCLIPADGFYEWVRTGKPSSHTASKSMTESCSHSQDCGIAGKTLAVAGERPARF
jgi:putative SOS response-associated peptidase YedK